MKHRISRIILLVIVPTVVLILAAGHSFGESLFKIPDDATAKTLDGKTAKLGDFAGKLVFLNMWRTDCIACLVEIPLLNRLQKEYSSESFTIIGVSMDRGKDKFVAEFVKRMDIAYPVWLAYGQPLAKYVDVPVLPFLFAIGPDGRVVGHAVGAFRSYEEAVSAVKQARYLMEEVDPES